MFVVTKISYASKEYIYQQVTILGRIRSQIYKHLNTSFLLSYQEDSGSYIKQIYIY